MIYYNTLPILTGRMLPHPFSLMILPMRYQVTMLSFQKMKRWLCSSGRQINSTELLLEGAAAVTHLTFGSNAYVSVDRCLRPQVDGLLDADISQGVFSKDRTSIKVGSHEAAEARQRLV